jgi:TonB-dependent starch-binding outer membrane protein SusC
MRNFLHRINQVRYSACLVILWLLWVPHAEATTGAKTASDAQWGNVPSAVMSVSGIVTNEDGGGLPGVTVFLKETKTGTVTDANGRFRIDVPGPQSVLVFSYVGMISQEVTVGNVPRLTITLKDSPNALNEVVVVGYGTQKKSDLTGSVAQIKAEDLKKTPITSLDQGLQGRAAGVQVTQSDGQPGATTSIRIRGGNSVTAGNEPLYVIDGIPIYNDNAAQSGGATVGASTNALASLNPADIESIEILKDASAKAIYGSRGANGVVLVSTKRGKAGRNTIQFETYYGMQEVRRKLDLLNNVEYATFLNDATAAFNATAPANQQRKLPFTNLDSLRNSPSTDWQGEIFRRAPIRNYQLSLSGGDDKTLYAVSLGYFKQDGIILNSDFERYSLRLNLDRRISKKFKIGNSLTISRVASRKSITATDGANNAGAVLLAIDNSPTLPIYNPDGSPRVVDEFGSIFNNPVAQALFTTNQTATTRMLANLFGEYQLMPNLTAKVSIGADLGFTKDDFYAPRTTFRGFNVNGLGQVGSAQNYNLLNENTLTYNRTVGKHSINVLAGVTAQQFTRDFVSASGQNFSNDNLGHNSLNAASEFNRPVTNFTRSSLFSLLGRVNYSYADKYLVTLTGRSDGSSRFGADNRYAFFPSASVAWRVMQEDFMKKQNLLTDLKLRASYGSTGNQEIPLYQSLSTLANNGYPLGDVYQNGFSPARIANPNLKWETTSEYDLGLEMAAFDNRISLTADYYYKRTKDLLLFAKLPWNSGFEESLLNLGELENKGLELTLNTVNLDGEFNWTTNVNYAANRNTVLDLGGQTSFLTGGSSSQLKINNTHIVQVGQPVGAFYGYVADGIYQATDNIASGPQKTALPGDIRYVDLDGNNLLNSSDQTIIGQAQPKFIGGITNTFSYKGIELSVFLQGSYGNQLMNLNRLETESQATGKSGVLRDRWTPTNPSNTVPRAVIPNPGFVASTRIIEDGSYLRARTITLAYKLPTPLLSRVGVRNARVYVTGQNLLTWTRYTGYDPEVSRFGQSGLAQGVDYGGYPLAKTILAGLTIGL